MKIIYSEKCLSYPGYPESPDRVRNAFEYLKNLGYEFLEPKPASEKDLLLVHSKEYIQKVKRGISDLDTPWYKNIYEIAKLSAGGAILASKKAGFSLMRPPGHHAGKNGIALGAPTRGFCYFNNIAIAVRKLGLKTLILDIDCHAPNGTTEIFYNTDQVLLLSLHQWSIYPWSGWYTEIGAGDGKGYTINIPLYPNTGDDVYLKVLEEFLFPLVDQFKPYMIAVSAGFDAHRSETLTQMNLSLNSFYRIGSLLRKVTKKVMFVLEGGYSPVFPKAVCALIEGFEGKEIKITENPTETPKEIYKKTEERIRRIKDYLSSYWKF